MVTHFELDLDQMSQRMYKTPHWKKLSRVVDISYMHHLPSNSQRCKFVINLCPSPLRSPPPLALWDNPTFSTTCITSRSSHRPCGSPPWSYHAEVSSAMRVFLNHLRRLYRPPNYLDVLYIGIWPPIPTALFDFPLSTQRELFYILALRAVRGSLNQVLRVNVVHLPVSPNDSRPYLDSQTTHEIRYRGSGNSEYPS